MVIKVTETQLTVAFPEVDSSTMTFRTTDRLRHSYTFDGALAAGAGGWRRVVPTPGLLRSLKLPQADVQAAVRVLSSEDDVDRDGNPLLSSEGTSGAAAATTAGGRNTAGAGPSSKAAGRAAAAGGGGAAKAEEGAGDVDGGSGRPRRGDKSRVVYLNGVPVLKSNM